MSFPTNDWLESINTRFGNEGIAMIRRPFEALRLLSLEHRVSIDLDSDLAKQVFEWFKARSRPGEHSIGALFTGLYFFDGRFWAVEIPVFFGTVNLQPADSLKDVPDLVRRNLLSNVKELGNYLAVWTDCLDYGSGIGLAEGQMKDEFATGLMRSGDQELRAAVTQLLEHRPNPKAAMSCRMAVEMFLKAYLATVASLDDAKARKLNHELDAVLDEIAKAAPQSDILRVRPLLESFPKIKDRYKGQEVGQQALWCAYSAAQYCGAALVRLCTPQDSRGQLRQLLSQIGISMTTTPGESRKP